MKKIEHRTEKFKSGVVFIRTNWQSLLLILFLGAAFLTFSSISAQNQVTVTNSGGIFPVGERLTYNLKFDKFQDAGVAELFVASSGKLANRNAVEIQSRIKTTNLVSAVFFLWDESRTTFASPETGLPLYIKTTSNATVLPRERIQNFLDTPSSNFDLLTVIYQARFAGGIGNFSLQEDEKVYSVSFSKSGNERVKTDAGEFSTEVSTVQSQYFTDKGIRDLRINFSTDGQRMPVLFRFRTAKGEFRAALSGFIQATPTNTPLPTPAPNATFTPRPSPTPPKYIENQPLSPDLSFILGETLDYRVTANGRYIGVVTLQAKERKQINGNDSLVLTATVTQVEPNQQILNLNDKIETIVNPDTVSPFQFIAKFGGLYSGFSQTAAFLLNEKKQDIGKVSVNGSPPLDVPVGTHNVLSLLYAMRSFNLRPTREGKSPVDNTRVSVLLGQTANVFILRPSNAEMLMINSERINAQAINIQTGNPQIDALNLRIWLSNDEKRLPLRFVVGNGLYQADLFAERIVPPK